MNYLKSIDNKYLRNNSLWRYKMVTGTNFRHATASIWVSVNFVYDISSYFIYFLHLPRKIVRFTHTFFAI